VQESMGSPRPIVSLTTDFGARDPSAAICRGVILSIAPQATVIDVTHEIAKYRILDGALVLANAVPYLPLGVHVAVVDPGTFTPVPAGQAGPAVIVAAATAGGTRLIDNMALVLPAEGAGDAAHH